MEESTLTQPTPVTPIFISWTECHRLCRALSRKLHEEGAWKAMIAITRGGMVPAAIVARELSIRTVGTFSIDLYGIDKVQKEPVILLPPHTSLLLDGGAGVLVIDEVCDSSRTIRDVVRPLLPNAHIAVIHATRAGQKFVDTYVEEKEDGSWINYPWDTAHTYRDPISGRTD